MFLPVRHNHEVFLGQLAVIVRRHDKARSSDEQLGSASKEAQMQEIYTAQSE